MRSPPVTSLDDADFVTVKEAAGILRICVASIYNLKAAGAIRFVKLGSRTRIATADLRRLRDDGGGATSRAGTMQGKPPEKRPPRKKSKASARSGVAA